MGQLVVNGTSVMKWQPVIVQFKSKGYAAAVDDEDERTNQK